MHDEEKVFCARSLFWIDIINYAYINDIFEKEEKLHTFTTAESAEDDTE